MKENQLPLLFESVRSVPTEIKLEQVSNTISSFPAVIRKPWYTKINLNMFLMTSSLLIITTAAVFLANTGVNSDNSAESQQIVEIERLDLSDKKLSLIKPKTPNEIIFTTLEQDSIFVYQEPFISESKDTAISDTIVLNQLNAANQKLRYSTREEIQVRDVMLNTSQAKHLQKTLEDWVEGDGLGRGGNSIIKIQYHPEYLVINSDTLTGSTFNKYRNLLFQYNITPGNNRYLFSNKKYMMAGDFVDGSFRGSVLGRLMRIKITKTPGYIKQEGTEKQKAILHFTDFEPTNQKYKEATFIDTNGHSMPKQTLKKSDSIDESRLKELHIDIVSLFKSYDFKTKGHFKYTMSLSESTLNLGQRSLNSGQKRELINLLADYNIHLKDNRLLMLNDYGIMLVDEVEPKKNTFISWLKPGRIFKIAGTNLKEIERSFLRDN